MPFNTAGTFYWQAVFSGDGNNAGTSSACTSEAVTVGLASPTISTQLNVTPITVGESDYDTAALAGFAPNGTGGTVTYTVYTDDACTTGAQTMGTASFNEGTGASSSNPVTFNTVGTVSWNAVFNGDSNNNPTAVSSCEQLVVDAASPTISTELSSASITVGDTDFDTATLSNSFVPGGSNGTVTYTVYTDSGCTTGAQSAGTEDINEMNGAVPPSSTLPFNTAGTFYWQAVFSGDGNNAGTSSACTSEAVTVGLASPTISTQLNVTPITVGESDYDTAALAGFAPNGTGGTVTYTVYTDDACTIGAESAGTEPINESTGVATQSSSVTFTSAGTVSWEARFNGDTNNNAVTSACEPLVVSKASPAIVTVLNAPSIAVGGTDYDTAALSNFAPNGTGGTVTYTVYTNGSCTAGAQTVGTASFSETTGASKSNGVTFTSAGSVSWNAVFNGDSNNNATAVSSCEPLTVTPASPTISTHLSATSITVGGTDFDTAALTGFAPNGSGGTVTYTVYTNGSCTTGAQTVTTASFSETTGASTSNPVTFTSAGSVSWNAVFNGDSNNNATAVSSCEPLTVTKAAPTIATTLQFGAITVGQTDYDTSALSNFAPGGASSTVTYTVYTNNTCTTVSQPGGTVSVNESNGAVPQSSVVNFKTAGTFYWQAAFSGDSNNAATSSPCMSEQVNVAKASPTLGTTLNANPITVGGSDFDTAALTGFAAGGTAGTVTYTAYTSSNCTSGGQTAGTEPINESTGVATQSSPMTFTSAGNVSWEAVFNGDTNNNTATSACESLVVSKASPTITTTLNAPSIPVGGSDYDTAALTGFAANGTGGTVTYTMYTNGSCSTGAQTVGTASFSETTGASKSNPVMFTSAGSVSWSAVFNGDSNNNATAVSSCEALTVTKASPTISTHLNANPITVGSSDYDTAALTGFAPNGSGGTVTYTVYTNGSCTAGAQTVGTASFSETTGASTSNPVTFTSAGSVSWNAVFNGDSNNNATAVSSCEPLTVSKAAPTIATTLQSGAITVGQTDYDTSALSNFAPGGASSTVTYTVYTNNTCTTVSQPGGTVSVNESNGAVPQSSVVNFKTAGTFYWQAAFSGDSNNAATSSPCMSEQVNVAKASPTLGTTLNANPITVGGSDFDTAALTGFAPGGTGGTVTYTAYTSGNCTSGGQTAGTEPINETTGVATQSSSVTFTSAGSASWEATFNSDTNNNTATSACEPLVVSKASPTITTTASPITGTVGTAIMPRKTPRLCRVRPRPHPRA